MNRRSLWLAGGAAALTTWGVSSVALAVGLLVFVSGETSPTTRLVAAGTGILLIAFGIAVDRKTVSGGFPSSVTIEGRDRTAGVMALGVVAGAVVWIGGVLAAEAIGSAEKLGILQIWALGIGIVAALSALVVRQWYRRVVEVSLPVRGSRGAQGDGQPAITLVRDTLLRRGDESPWDSVSLMTIHPGEWWLVKPGAVIAGSGVLLLSSSLDSSGVQSVVHLSRDCPWQCPYAVHLSDSAVFSVGAQSADLVVLLGAGGVIEQIEPTTVHDRLFGAVQRNVRGGNLIELAGAGSPKAKYQALAHPIGR